MIEETVSRLWWHRYLRHACSWRELDEFPCLSPTEQQRVLAERMRAQIKYFGRREDALPGWREAAEVRDATELWRVWPTLPIVDRQLLQTVFDARELQARFHLEGAINTTGGSTGEPSAFLHDPPMLRACFTSTIYTRLKMGWQPGMATLAIWGSERDIGKETGLGVRLHHRLLRSFLVGGYNLTSETVERVLAVIRRHAPVAIYGFTSMLEFVARTVTEKGLQPPPGCVRTAWNGGEMLFDEQSAVFRQAFGVPVLNLYGGRELSAMACQFFGGGPLRILRPWLFVEIVDDQGKPVGPGESGRLLWTSTICRGTPFLRYDVGDLGAFAHTHQDESGISALAQLHGRVAGVLKLPNGKNVNCLYWNHLFKEMREVRQFQVILKRDGSLKLLLKGTGFTPRREAELRATIGDFTGGLPLQVSWVDKIPLTPQGKLVQVVNESRSHEPSRDAG